MNARKQWIMLFKRQGNLGIWWPDFEHLKSSLKQERTLISEMEKEGLIKAVEKTEKGTTFVINL